MSRTSLLCFLALLLSLAGRASAGPLVEVSIIDRDTGQWLPGHPYRGDRWIAGTPGHRYGVRMTNTTGQRVLVVLSVDGINAVNGQTAHPSQAGYVLAPWESAEITGWRKSLDDVAQFVFTDIGDSYAARTGRPGNVGVIGLAVFRESAPRPLPSPPIARGRMHEAAPAAGNRAESAHADTQAARQSIGTGHGQREWAPVGQTHFVRATRQPAEITELRYDDGRRLIARGVIPSQPSPYHTRPYPAPRAFPGNFVPDPPGYRR